MKSFKYSASAIALAVSSLIYVNASAQTTATPQLMANNGAIVSLAGNINGMSALMPQPPTNDIQLDYAVLNDALGGTVIRLGPSTRRHMSRPSADVGSRFVSGHTSAYRLEGSRVAFYFFNEEYLEELTAYRQDLERIATQIDLTHMPHNEQLAFWFNMHNVALIEQIAKQHPVRRPQELEIDGVKLDDAKILNIKNVDLSLRDIREKIVYPSWNSPNVMYGFFRGDIGSPALQNYAYTSNNVQEVLAIQAAEFVNALRGFNLTSKNRNVSQLYQEAQPFYFKNWEQDLTAHLLNYARPEVAEEIREVRDIKVGRYDTTIADLVGGSRPRISTGYVQASNTTGGKQIPGEVLRLLRELDTKTDVLRHRKLIGQGRGTVTIHDIETIDVDIPTTVAE